VRTQILLMEPLPSINMVFSLIMQQERQIVGVTNQTAKTKILASTTDRQNQWKQDQNWKNQGRRTRLHGQGQGRERNPNYGK